MHPWTPYIPAADTESTVSSKGQVTLPKALRDHLGIRTGTRLRFSLNVHGGFEADCLRYELEDLWAPAEEHARAAENVMSFEEMDEAKARRSW